MARRIAASTRAWYQWVRALAARACWIRVSYFALVHALAAHALLLLVSRKASTVRLSLCWACPTSTDLSVQPNDRHSSLAKRRGFFIGITAREAAKINEFHCSNIAWLLEQRLRTEH